MSKTKLERIDTRNMPRSEWLELRRKTIGGSDAAGIVGLSHYATPYTVWANKTGRLPDVEDNESMRQGRDLEEYVASRWELETGKKVRRANVILYNPQYPFAHADIDRRVVGERAGLECKTTATLNIRQFHGVDFPEQYYVQCVHYLAVTGYDRWYLAVLVFGKGFFTFTLERNQAEIDALMTAERDFWKLVEADAPPTLDGCEPTTKAMQQIYAQSAGGDVLLFGREEILRKYFDLRNEQKTLAEEIDRIENVLKGDMQSCERGSCEGYSISWKTQTRRQFQAKAFAEQYPDIDLAPFYSATISRPFKVKQTQSNSQLIQAG